MKTSYFLRVLLAPLALAGFLVNSPAAPVASPVNAARAVPTNAVQKSVFTVPKSPKDGCDPFFPNSSRLWAITLSTNQPVKAVGLDCLVLKGLSGPTGNRLAIISGRTMSRGENAEIVTDCGRLTVHCVDVTANSAIIEVAGQRRELRMPSDF